MTNAELGLLPSGHLHLFFTTGEDRNALREPGLMVRGFDEGIPAGLIALAAKEHTAALSPTLGFWRSFACRYLAERCRIAQADPTHPGPVPALDEPETAALLEGAPPMRGAEYLSAQALNDIWFQLDDWLRARIRRDGSLAV
ncbi:MAG: hypothetical protein ACREQ8_05180, partial [Woeseiaceae bacterium]